MGTKKTVAISTLALAMITGVDTTHAQADEPAQIQDSIKPSVDEKVSEWKQAKQNVKDKVSELKQEKQNIENKV
ncbi:cell wall anchor protein, partial [Bacillus cytotoxicus]